MGRFRRLILACGALLGAAALGLASNAYADSIGDFYRGKTVYLLIGVDVGGEYDTVARLVGRHIGRHIPGNPAVVPQNMVGASGLKMANHLATIAPQDGTNIGMMSNELPMNNAMGNPGIQFDVSKLQWIGSPSPLVEVLLVWGARGVHTLAEARDRTLTVGTPTKTSIHNYLVGMVNHYAHARFKMVTGYAGGNATDLAMERGEVDGRVVAWSAVQVTKPEWIRDGKVVPLVQFGPKAADLATVPSASDFAKTEQQRQIVELLISSTRLGRPFAAGPGVPADRIAALRAAFDETMKDPAFLAEAKTMKVAVAPVTGAEMTDIVHHVFATPPAVIAEAKRMNE
jgi:tripartite-type tricarboxylate transporter receptor subunit TctC